MTCESLGLLEPIHPIHSEGRTLGSFLGCTKLHSNRTSLTYQTTYTCGGVLQKWYNGRLSGGDAV